VNAIETFLDFLHRINKRDADTLAELMTEDHVFIDSLGNTMQGRETIRVGWRGHYSFCPDDWVTHVEILGNGNIVAVFGAASGAVAAMANFHRRTNGGHRLLGWLS
jgi:ketosteroid isomerase-like protein